MPNRVIRDEILESARWLDLPTDTHRVVFIALVLRADDYGNFEGGPRRLFRFMHSFSQVKTDSDSVKLMSDLQDADLVLRYEVQGMEYWHIPRFENKRQYWARRVPKSPYHEEQIPEKQIHRQKALRGIAEHSTNPQSGVGVGVGVGGNSKALRPVDERVAKALENIKTNLEKSGSKPP